MKEGLHIDQSNFRILLPSKIVRAAEKIAGKHNLSLKDALIAFYESDIYKMLEDEETKTWWESPAQLFRDYEMSLKETASTDEVMGTAGRIIAEHRPAFLELTK